MSGETSVWDALFARRTLGIRLGLEAIAGLHEAMGSPAWAFPAIHVLGTNGKGSTSAMAAHVLRGAGFRVGLYTSPHLERVTERVVIDGQPIDDARLQALVGRVLTLEAKSISRGQRPLSFFEVLTLAAFEAFREAAIDVAVVEAGLGGRLDATRLVRPRVTVLTSIARDHEAFLGHGLAAIAREKVDVVTPEAPCLSAPQAPEVEAVLREVCGERGVRLRFVAPLAEAPSGLVGEHQKKNGALALEAVRVFVPPAQASDLDGVYWPGRLEQVPLRAGRVVFDVAHNPDGVAAACRALAGADRPPRLIVFGCAADKDATSMLAELQALGGELWGVPLPGQDVERPTWWPPSGRARWCPEGLRSERWWAAFVAEVEAGASALVIGSHALVGTLRPLVRAVASGREVTEVWRSARAVDPGDPRAEAKRPEAKRPD